MIFIPVAKLRAAHGLDKEQELAEQMARELSDDIEAEVFCGALVHEIIDEYRRGGIEPGQAVESVIFQAHTTNGAWIPTYHQAAPPIPLKVDEIWIDFVLPNVEIYANLRLTAVTPGPIFLGDPQFITKAASVLRDSLKILNEGKKVYHYELRQGTYYLIKDSTLPVGPIIAPNNIILATDTLAICFAIDKIGGEITYILHKHGGPENVHKWAKSTRAAYRKAGMEDLARSITVIEGKFPVEEVNKCLDNSGYLKKFCEQYNLIEGTSTPTICDQDGPSTNP